MTTYPRDVYLSWLAGAGLPAEHLTELLTHFPDVSAIHERLMQGDTEPFRAFLPGKTADQLRTAGRNRVMDKLAVLLERESIRAALPGEKEYPEVLLPLNDPPAVLFYRGNPDVFSLPSAAMIGSRSASWKGQAATEKIARELSENGIAVISGLAYGIDAAAHRGCLKGGSPTIAVLGCGLDQDYPAEHAALKREILENGGLILSEYAPGEKPLGWHFPIRNRIISGLAECLVVMEARIRSGSMTTVRHALDQGKDVFVYPGEPDNPKSEGNHLLLREGAIYFTSARDIMEDMRWLDKKKEVGHNSSCASGGSPSDGPMDAQEQKILDLLSGGERSFDELCEALALPAGQLMSSVTMMQIRGLIEAMPGKLYRIKLE